MTVNDDIFIAKQTTQALAYMHGLNPPILHRGIKPKNILVSTQLKLQQSVLSMPNWISNDHSAINLQVNDDLHVYLTDFGLTKIREGAATMTNVAVEVGTPKYASPETLDGLYGTQSDIWSLGIVFIELFSKERAWQRLCKSQTYC